jgi:hypothetical protein
LCFHDVHRAVGQAFRDLDSPRQRSGEQVVEMTVWNDVRATQSRGVPLVIRRP